MTPKPQLSVALAGSPEMAVAGSRAHSDVEARAGLLAAPKPPSPSILKGVAGSAVEKRLRLTPGAVLLLVVAAAIALVIYTEQPLGRGKWTQPPPDTSILPPAFWRLPLRDRPTRTPKGILVGDTVKTQHGVVVSESAICSEMGANMLRKGGNAVDAGVAVATCLGVTGSFFSGPGGGGFLTLRTPKGKSQTINFREAAPSTASRDMFKDHEQDAQLGGKAAGVPGEFAGLHMAHKLHGRLPWANVILPSSNLSYEFPVTPTLAMFIDLFGKTILDSDLASFLAPDGKLLKMGDTVRRPAYARMLQRVALEGPDAFYRSELTANMVKYLNSAGGQHRLEDWNNYQAELQESLTGTFRGTFRIHTAPPPASGAVLLSILSILDKLPPFDRTGREGTFANETQRMIESFKWSYAWRGALGDPGRAPDYEFNPNITKLLREATDPVRARIVASKIKDDETHEPEFYEPKFDPKEMPGTTHFSVIDKEGWAVSMTSTVNLLWGNRMVEPSTGVVLNNEMDDFSWPGYVNNGSQSGLPASPANYIAPNKRPLSASAPVIVELLDPRGHPIDVVLAVGGAGGSRITTAVAQVLLNILDRGMTVEQAMLQPRAHHQLYPNKLFLEPHTPDWMAQQFEAIGHEVLRMDAAQHLAVVSAVTKDGDWIEGTADPRVLDGGAAGI